MLNIGIDFGGVLSIHDNMSLNQEHKNTSINMPFAIENLLKLKQDGHKLYLISFCGKKRALETHEAILNSELKDVFEKEFYVKNVEYKSIVCKYLDCHVMIDDTSEILESITKLYPNIFPILFEDTKNWNDIYTLISSLKIEKNQKQKEENENISKFIYDIC